MKKYLSVLLLLTICFFTTNVYAKEKVYNICKNGCEYDDLLIVFMDINLLNDNYDVVINFKDDESYTFDELLYGNDESRLNNVIENACIDRGGTYSYDERYHQPYCFDENNNDLFANMSDNISWNVDSVFITNRLLKSLTINGSPNKTKISATQFDDSISLLSMFAYIGATNVDFEINNIIANSLYFAADNKRIKGVINNCEINSSVLGVGNVDIEIKNSKLNNVYSMGDGAIDYSDEYYSNFKGSPIITVDSSNTFNRNYVRINDKKIEELGNNINNIINDNGAFNQTISEYVDSHPKPEKPDNTFYSSEEWKKYDEEMEKWYADFTKMYDEEIEKFFGNVSLSGNDMITLIFKLFENSLPTQSIEEYKNTHPLPEEVENAIPKRSDYSNVEEYWQAYAQFQDIMKEHMQELVNWYKGYLDIMHEEGALDLFDYSTLIAQSVLFPTVDLQSTSVVELGEATIRISRNSDKSMQIHDKMNLQEISYAFNTSLEGWKSSDESIVKIENGHIVCLRVGEVDLVKEVDNDTYNVHIVVRPEDLMDIVNPETGRNILFITIIVLVILSNLYFIRKKKKSL